MNTDEHIQVLVQELFELKQRIAELELFREDVMRTIMNSSPASEKTRND